MKKTTVQELEKRLKCVESGHLYDVIGLRRECSPICLGWAFYIEVKCRVCGETIVKYINHEHHKLAAAVLLEMVPDIKHE